MPHPEPPLVPIYQEVVQGLRAAILSGQYPPGARLPNEHDLTRIYAVSRETVRRALGELKQEGLVLQVPGRGTFTRSPSLELPLQGLTGFVEDMAGLGLATSTRVLAIGLVPASQEVAGQLGTETGARVVRIRRLRSAGGEPRSYDVTYILRDPGDRLAVENLAEEPILAILEQKYGLALGEARCRLEATTATAAVARVLGVAKGAPLFLIRRTIFADNGAALASEELYYRGDCLRFTMRLVRVAGRHKPGDQHRPAITGKG